MISEARKEQLRAENFKKSRRQDNKQHCQKILDGISKFDNTTAERAIWELIQNARDLSMDAHIKIELNENSLIFSHNGKPFNYETFTSLIKQVSSEEKEDPNAAGQFGTGFMTTHKFSRKIRINGCMKIDENAYVEIDFELDRTANDLQSMIDSMTKQLEYADKLLDKEATSTPCQETTFIYELDEDHFSAGKQGVTAAFELMPYVMTFNERIKEVSIIDYTNNKKETYTKKQQTTFDENIGLKSINIETIEGNNKTIYYLQSVDNKDIIILPLKTINKAMSINGIPRLFIYFPLLGTHTFGFNYIFHSERFFPEEPRNAIVLPEDNIDKKYKYEINEKVIYSMLNMLFQFLDKYGETIENAKLIAPITINLSSYVNSHKLTQDFYSNLKKSLTQKYQTIPFLSINNEPVSVSQSDKVRFLASDIVKFLRTEEGAKYLDVVYTYANLVSPLPSKEEVLDWSEIVIEWDDSISSRFITIEDIVNAINKGNDNNQLHEFLLFLKDSGQTSYFNNKELIPNREGKRKRASELYNANDIPSVLYNICKTIVPNDTNKFVDINYIDIYDFSKYTRENLKKSINDYVENQTSSSSNPFQGTLNSLIEYCSIFPIQNGTSIRNKAMPYICDFFGKKYIETFVAPLEGVGTDIEQNLYKKSFETLVEYTLKQIQNKGENLMCEDGLSWFEKNKTLHYKILESLCNRDRPTEYQTKTFKNYAIIPNLEGKLCKVENLNVIKDKNYIPKDKLDKLFTIYQKVFQSKYQEKLIDDQYAWMFTFEGIDPKKIGSIIDETLNVSQYKNSVTIEIIDYLDKDDKDGYWHKWFENIDRNKPDIFFRRLEGDDRLHTYKFLKAPAKKKEAIAELVDNPNFDIIIQKAHEYIQNEQDKALVFNHMYRIGKAIEEKLREELKTELLQVEFREKGETMEINDIQNGQDIVIRYNDNIVYYIEVKSKWNFNQPAHMSTNQMRQAVLNHDKYALCCVDLTNYSSEIANEIDIDTILNNTYVHLNIGEVLGYYLKTIVNDNRDEENNIKIKDYQSNLNKGFFKQGEKGLNTLIADIIKKCNI